MKASKDKHTKDLKREVEAMTSAVGFKGEAKNRATEIMILNNKAAAVAQQQSAYSNRQKLEQQEELKSKVN